MEKSNKKNWQKIKAEYLICRKTFQINYSGLRVCPKFRKQIYPKLERAGQDALNDI
jgi:hypothetical protein